MLQGTNLHLKDALVEANEGVCSGEFITEKILAQLSSSFVG